MMIIISNELYNRKRLSKLKVPFVVLEG
jgi:hypothetical protein